MPSTANDASVRVDQMVGGNNDASKTGSRLTITRTTLVTRRLFLKLQTDLCEWYTPIVKVISCTVTPVSPTARFSSVTGGALVLEGAFGLAIPFLARRKQLGLGKLDGVGMDSEQGQDKNDIYMGIAQYIPTVSHWEHVHKHLTSTWGLILRPLADSSSTTLVYERVGWFNAPVWNYRNRIKRGAITII